MRETVRIITMTAGMLAAVGQATAQESRGLIILPWEGDQVRMGTRPAPTLIKVDSATTGSRELFAFQVSVPPGDSLPLHRHHRDDELIFVHEGTVRGQVGDRVQAAPAGSLLYVPASVPVGLVNTGHLPATLFIVFAAPHMSAYIRALGVPPGAPLKVLTKPELDSIARRHHITFP